MEKREGGAGETGERGEAQASDDGAGEAGVKLTHQGGCHEPGVGSDGDRPGLPGRGWREGQAGPSVLLPRGGRQQEGQAVQAPHWACCARCWRRSFGPQAADPHAPSRWGSSALGFGGRPGGGDGTPAGPESGAPGTPGRSN